MTLKLLLLLVSVVFVNGRTFAQQPDWSSNEVGVHRGGYTGNEAGFINLFNLDKLLNPFNLPIKQMLNPFNLPKQVLNPFNLPLPGLEAGEIQRFGHAEPGEEAGLLNLFNLDKLLNPFNLPIKQMLNPFNLPKQVLNPFNLPLPGLEAGEIQRFGYAEPGEEAGLVTMVSKVHQALRNPRLKKWLRELSPSNLKKWWLKAISHPVLKKILNRFNLPIKKILNLSKQVLNSFGGLEAGEIQMGSEEAGLLQFLKNPALEKLLNPFGLPFPFKSGFLAGPRLDLGNPSARHQSSRMKANPDMPTSNPTDILGLHQTAMESGQEAGEISAVGSGIINNLCTYICSRIPRSKAVCMAACSVLKPGVTMGVRVRTHAWDRKETCQTLCRETCKLSIPSLTKDEMVDALRDQHEVSQGQMKPSDSWAEKYEFGTIDYFCANGPCWQEQPGGPASEDEERLRLFRSLKMKNL